MPPQINEIFDAPVLADITGDDKPEILAANVRAGAPAQIMAWQADGTLVPGWPVNVVNTSGISRPAVGDIDGDYIPEIIAVENRGSTESSGYVYAWRYDGTLVPGWPQNVNGFLLAPVIGDLDNDWQAEIIVKGNSGLFVFKNDGTIIAGWPKPISGVNNALGFGALFLANLDTDIMPEVALVSGNDAGAGGQNLFRVEVFNADGSTFGNWPYSSGAGSVYAYTGGAANIDTDTGQEIIIPAFNTQDNKTYLYVFKNNGTTASGYPKGMDIDKDSMPAISDLDNNGEVELACFGANRLFYVYDFDGYYNNRKMDWPMLGRNAQHTGNYGLTDNNNTAPELDPIGNKTVNENQLLSFAISATDADADALTYSASGLPSGASFNASTRIFSWIPTYAQAGNYQVTFNVTDGQFSDSETVTITVNNVNRPPVLNYIGPKTINENQLLTFTISASDPDGNILAYSASGLPSGATFTPSTRTFSWKPTYTQAGTYNITFRVTDGSLSDYETVRITVNNVNLPPKVVSLSPSYGSSYAGKAVYFTAKYSDPDGWKNIAQGYFLVNTVVSGKKCLYVYYNQNTNKLYLRNNANTGWIGGYKPGATKIIENSYAKLYCANTTVSGSGSYLTIKFRVLFKSTFKGKKEFLP